MNFLEAVNFLEEGLAEAGKEIELLTSEAETHEAELKLAEAEVKRLRGELAGVANTRVERLREALDNLTLWAKEYTGGVIPAHFVVERIREAALALPEVKR